MNLHEYQAKELLASYGLPVQGGILAHNGEEAAAAYDKLGGKFAVVKAQVHAGGRGKAGGVKVVKSREEAKEVAESLIGTNLPNRCQRPTCQQRFGLRRHVSGSNRAVLGRSG